MWYMYTVYQCKIVVPRCSLYCQNSIRFRKDNDDISVLHSPVAKVSLRIVCLTSIVEKSPSGLSCIVKCQVSTLWSTPLTCWPSTNGLSRRSFSAISSPSKMASSIAVTISQARIDERMERTLERPKNADVFVGTSSWVSLKEVLCDFRVKIIWKWMVQWETSQPAHSSWMALRQN